MTNTLRIYGYRCPQDDDVIPTDLAQECQNDEGFAYTDPLVRLKDVRELVQKGGRRAVSGWQSIETAPKGDCIETAPSIAIFAGRYRIVGYWDWEVEDWVSEEGVNLDLEYGEPTHWAELPYSEKPTVRRHWEATP